MNNKLTYWITVVLFATGQVLFLLPIAGFDYGQSRGLQLSGFDLVFGGVVITGFGYPLMIAPKLFAGLSYALLSGGLLVSLIFPERRKAVLVAAIGNLLCLQFLSVHWLQYSGSEIRNASVGMGFWALFASGIFLAMACGARPKRKPSEPLSQGVHINIFTDGRPVDRENIGQKT